MRGREREEREQIGKCCFCAFNLFTLKASVVRMNEHKENLFGSWGQRNLSFLRLIIL